VKFSDANNLWYAKDTKSILKIHTNFVTVICNYQRPSVAFLTLWSSLVKFLGPVVCRNKIERAADTVCVCAGHVTMFTSTLRLVKMQNQLS